MRVKLKQLNSMRKRTVIREYGRLKQERTTHRRTREEHPRSKIQKEKTVKAR